MAQIKIIPILLGICLLLSIGTAHAERFRGKHLRVDTRIGTELSPTNDGQTTVPVMYKGDTVQFELFIEGVRSARTRAFTIAFENANNSFGEHFVINRIEGILPQAEAPGPTVVKARADFPATIFSNDYLATITLTAKKDIPPGLRVSFDGLRTNVMDEQTQLPDTLNVLNTFVTFGRPNYDLFLDLDTSPGNQKLVESLGLSTANDISVQVFGERIRLMSGFILRFEYDTSQLEFSGFTPGDALPNAQTLDPVQTALDSPVVEVEVTAASFGGSASVEDGLLGTLLFKPLDTLKRTGVVMSGAEIRRTGSFRPFFTPLTVELARLDADFDKDGTIGFRDFVLFAEHFGTRRGDGRYDPIFDLFPDSIINFADFVLFTESITTFKVTILG